MKLLIIGASRGIGEKLLAIALKEKFEVTVLARNPQKIKLEHPNLSVIKGDILDATAVKLAVEGQNAVCLCIGIPPTQKPVDVFSKGTANVLAAIDNNSETILLAVTGVGAGDSKGHGGFLYDNIINPLLLKSVYADKDRQEALIRASSCKWIIVRPAMLSNGKMTGNYKVINNLAGVTAKKISREDVADFMLNELKHPSCIHKAPLITY